MSGIIMVQRDHPVSAAVALCDDQMAAEKIVAFSKWLKEATDNGFTPVGNPTVVFQPALFEYSGCHTHVLRVAGWVTVTTSRDYAFPVFDGDYPLEDIAV